MIEEPPEEPPPNEEGQVHTPDFGLNKNIYKNLKKVIVGQGSNTDFKTIQSAVSNVSPGTVIIVKDGVYNESVTISASTNNKLANLSASAPLIIVAENPHEAVLRAPSGNNGFYILSGYVQIHNLKIITGTPGTDTAPVKIIGAGESLNDFANRRRHFVIAGNLIDTVSGQRGQDIVKVASVDNIRILGNLFDGEFRQDGIDHVSVTRSWVMYNTWLGQAMNGFSVKGGSQDIVFSHNDLQFTNSISKGNGGWQDGTRIGGIGYSRINRERPDEIRKTEATRVLFENNVIESQTVYGLIITGAEENIIRNNYIAPKGAVIGGTTSPKAVIYSTAAPSGRYKNDPSNIPGWTLPGSSNSAAVGHRDSGNNLIENNIYHSSIKTFHLGSQSKRLINGKTVDQRHDNIEKNNRPGTLKDVNWNYGAKDFDHLEIYRLLGI